MATLDWYGCATFRLRIAGITVFLDAYIDRVPGAPGTGLTADDVDECDWIVVGHSHFDHLWGAERIIANTGATMIGSYESVRLMEEAGVDADRLIAVAGGETVRLSDDVTVDGAARASTAACGRTPGWRRAARCASATSASRGRSSASGWATSAGTSPRSATPTLAAPP